ncbi:MULTISPECIES: MFS transporter [unclassified Leeuwenhoekiella]|uniref:MFS transporter n=1 Tax=unclassified Leeuwenhoekiella TaxID=2615029 RepID=UPI000C3A29DD|nr:MULTISPECIES: MFS transporter [unclassified Leeuwenhoekiella]MAW94397.1 MFS transporter [Leeuwenhoekiella sp.]MBA81074.1 MFS transporter [Leeuwenhoekiella sp.]|tara:strand:+ start:560 stop:1876 length:1317 start_codon:yes stop_codon:yes gene_type:complete
MSTHHPTELEKLYDYLNDEEDARTCKAIGDDACRETPKNYFLILISNMLTSLGDTLSNPKTVLTWVMSYVNAPVMLISFIVPIRESGSMLPQLFIAHYIRKRPVRKYVWVLGSVLQFLAIAGIGFVALSFEGSIAGWLIILCLVAFSLSRGLCSIAFKDILGKTIPKTKRGRLKGYTASVSGALVLAAGLFILYKSKDDVGIDFYSYLIFFAASLWLIAALIYANIQEYPGETEGGKNGLKEAWERLGLLKEDKHFRNFVITRSLLLCSALTAPYYVLLAQRYAGKEAYLLGLFIIANGIASIISAPVWGKMADKSSKKVMTYSAILTASLGLIVVGIIQFLPALNDQVWLYPVAFFVLGIAHQGVRLGRKTYIVDMAEGNRRTDYVAVSNTLIGFILLIAGGLSALASLISVEGVIAMLSVLGILGAIKSATLPEVE